MFRGCGRGPCRHFLPARFSDFRPDSPVRRRNPSPSEKWFCRVRMAGRVDPAGKPNNSKDAIRKFWWRPRHPHQAREHDYHWVPPTARRPGSRTLWRLLELLRLCKLSPEQLEKLSASKQWLAPPHSPEFSRAGCASKARTSSLWAASAARWPSLPGRHRGPGG